MPRMFGQGLVRCTSRAPVRWPNSVLLFAPSVALLFFSHTPAFAYVLNGNRWPGSHPRVPYYISTTLEGNIPYDGSAPFSEVIQHVQNAANVWNTQGASEFQYFYAGTTAVNQVADDGINAIVFDTGICPYGSGCGAYAAYHQTNGIFRGFDIVLYKYFSGGNRILWKTQMTFPNQMDLWTVMLHELGHGLGLSHSEFIDVVMGSIGPGTTRRSLYADDIAGIQALYGPYTNEGFWPDANVAAPGASFQLSLDYPRAAGRNFGLFFNAEASGSTPMVPSDSRIMPLASPYENARDYLTIFLNPTCNQGGQCQNMFGTLDANGQATVTVQLPADALTSLGPDLYLAAVTRNTAMPSDYEDISVGVHVQIQEPSLCPNGTCELDETPCTCPQDCGAPQASEIPGSTCGDDLDNDCDGATDCVDTDCTTDSVTCPNGQIPTVSGWGLLVLTLLTLSAGTVAIRNRLMPCLSRKGA